MYSGFSKCLWNGMTLPTPSTRLEFCSLFYTATSETSSVYWLLILISNLTKLDLNILWDEAFQHRDGSLRWCSSPEFLVPVPLDSGDVTKPFVLVSLAGDKPNLHALPLDAKVNTITLCQVPESLYQKKCGFKNF